jgi:hypothetical protein
MPDPLAAHFFNGLSQRLKGFLAAHRRLDLRRRPVVNIPRRRHLQNLHLCRAPFGEPYLCCKIDKLLHIAKNGNIWYNVFVFVILPSLAPAAFKTKGGENMVLTKGEALEEALEIVKVMLSDSACTSIYPNAESAKDVAEFVRTLTDELVAIE